MKMYQVTISMIVVLAYMQQSFAQLSDFDLESREVIITTEKETIHAHVLDNEREIKAKSELKYAWYTRNMLMETQGGYSGHVLHGPYKSHYRNHQVRKSGIYFYGLKNKEWREWDESGNLIEISNWDKGVKSGSFQEFSESKLVKSGSYKKGKLHGVYREHAGEEITKMIKYKNGKEKPPKIKEPKPEKQAKKPKEKTTKHTEGKKGNEPSPQKEKKRKISNKEK